jgi:hypothetical protein
MNLGLHASAKLRERLLAEIRKLSSGDDAAKWAHQSLAEKNCLRASDAAQVEAIFEAKRTELTSISTGDPQMQEGGLANNSSDDRPRYSQIKTNGRPGTVINKSILALPEPRRIRDRYHVRFVAARPCLICGRVPSDPHDLRLAQSRALARKVSDEFTVPL